MINQPKIGDLTKLSPKELAELLVYYSLYNSTPLVYTDIPSGNKVLMEVQRRLVAEQCKLDKANERDPKKSPDVAVIDLNHFSVDDMLMEVALAITASSHNGNRAIKRSGTAYANEVLVAIYENRLVTKGEYNGRFFLLLHETPEYIPGQNSNVVCKGDGWVIYNTVMES